MRQRARCRGRDRLAPRDYLAQNQGWKISRADQVRAAVQPVAGRRNQGSYRISCRDGVIDHVHHEKRPHRQG